MKAMAVSGNLAQGRKKLPGVFQRDVEIILMLDDHRAWPAATGLLLHHAFRVPDNKSYTISAAAMVRRYEARDRWIVDQLPRLAVCHDDRGTGRRQQSRT